MPGFRPLTGFKKLFTHDAETCACDLCNPAYYVESAQRFIGGQDTPPPWMTAEECAAYDLAIAEELLPFEARKASIEARPGPTALLAVLVVEAP